MREGGSGPLPPVLNPFKGGCYSVVTYTWVPEPRIVQRTGSSRSPGDTGERSVGFWSNVTFDRHGSLWFGHGTRRGRMLM